MGAAMGIMMAAQGTSQISSAYSQSQAMRAQGDYQNRVAQTNADLDNLRAEDATQRGEVEATQHDVATRKLIGSQRADLASQGIDVNKGSASDVQADTAGLGAIDTLNIRNNAWRESWGYKVQAINDTYQGKFSQMAANNEASNTLLTGGAKAAGSFAQGAYYKYGQGHSTPSYSSSDNLTVPSSDGFTMPTFGGGR